MFSINRYLMALICIFSSSSAYFIFYRLEFKQQSTVCCMDLFGYNSAITDVL